ncbi:trypsin-like peptidase domain-containing protein [Anabaena sp. FACHB-1237]|uniref:effector-associated domain EAD1-containing protein n=1 Tax=Anabaena sp. FACHB-1237 TaxID=2692769 RepID=UPI001680D205|nr:effector-associated domain EAD1-containing protein [Anabaena sp. FACHB-1237]MBD2137938.1 trypsin-like peptidase domain-containing protein [Anabaena sp. FACHB-1237]
MNLSGAELKKLVNAIVSAYPSKEDLAMMVQFELGENLDAISCGNNLTQLVFNLMTKWAIPRGKISPLIIAAYGTNPDNPELKEFYQSVVIKKRFLVDSAVKNSDFGPDINWRGESDEIQLQSWLKPETDYWDVGFLKRAIEQSTSVCRIEIPFGNIMGTGVLITPNKILTNYHVLKYRDEDNLENNALNAILKFGCLTSDNGLETQGKCFQLDRQNPILCFSQTEELDYVLLQVEAKITQATDIQPARWDSQKLPIEKMGISVLQHPKGDSMKLSISQDGITGVYQNSGLVQYVNKTAVGSSGSPCFDENWYLVALHHAQKAKNFGSIREGILFANIYQEIKDFLN